MTLWIDADAAPVDVKDIVARAALRLELPALLVANQRLQTPANNPFVSAIRVAGGPDVADDHIAEEASPGDLAVTADIPLAARLVEKGVITLDPRGEEYTRENIGERLSIRDFMDGLRSTGVETGGPSAWGQKEKQAFAAAFDRALTRLLKRRR
ncbi:MAG: YaiI/YqxD family protein [Gemmatimonadota bacterium]